MTRGWGLQIELTDLEDVIFLANANRCEAAPLGLSEIVGNIGTDY